jgi:predicted nucleic acid-binding protein
VMAFIERHGLHGKGIGYVDAHLLAAVALTAGSSLWTRDKRLLAAAQGLGLAFGAGVSH